MLSLEKLMINLQKIVTTIKNIKSQNQTIENLIAEPFLLCHDYQIETYQVIDIHQKQTKKIKLTVDQETQTEELPIQTQNLNTVQFQQDQKNSIVECFNDNSKKKQKLDKLASKQIIDIKELSQNSEQTEPSQFSYCQSHFLFSLQNYEEEFQNEKCKIYQPTKVSKLKQKRSIIFQNYIKNLQDSLINKESQIQIGEEKQGGQEDQEEL